MARIRTIETIHVSLPLRREHKWAGLTEDIGGYLLVKMTDEDGGVGWGEAPALKDWGGDFGRYFGESPAIAKLVIDTYLLPALSGADPTNIIELHARMDRAIKGYPYSKAAVEFAAYDLAGRQLGVPVYTLLGGCARDAIPMAHSIGLLEFTEAEKEVAEVIEEGIKTIKIKIGVDAGRDVEMVRRIRAVTGDGIDLCVDANNGYTTPGQAIRAIKAMEAHNIKYAEQPVEGAARLAQVARAVDVPIMADESAWNAHDVIDLAERRAAQCISIYTTKSGGLFKSMEVAAVARGAGMSCNVNGSIETGIGNLANIQLSAAAPAVTLACVYGVSTPREAQLGQLAGIYYLDDLLTEPMTLVDGAIQVPNGPGMGMEVDLEKVAKYTLPDNA